MDPVKQAEGMKLAVTVQTVLSKDVCARAEANARMPELTGTEKQVRWAKEIRRNAIVLARNFDKTLYAGEKWR